MGIFLFKDERPNFFKYKMHKTSSFCILNELKRYNYLCGLNNKKDLNTIK